MENSHNRIVGSYSYSDREKTVDEISASAIELIEISLSQDTCYFELTSLPLEKYNKKCHNAQWDAVIEKIWIPSKELILKITNWVESAIVPSRFRVLEEQGNHCKCHFHGFNLDSLPLDNLKIYVHTQWIDSLRSLKDDFIDLSFIIEEGRDLENNQLLPRREEIMESLSRFKGDFENYLTLVARRLNQDDTLSVFLQPIECESDYDHECYSWSFMMKGIIT